jgi:hypothetical protein
MGEPRAALDDTINSDKPGNEEDGETRKLQAALEKFLGTRDTVTEPATAGSNSSSSEEAAPRGLGYVPNSTRRVSQLTGDFDRMAGVPTLSRTGERFGVAATDLGSSFEHKGKLYFLFGDTWGQLDQPGAWDAVAWTESADPEDILVNFRLEGDSKWLPPSVPGIKQGAFEVPSGGISVADTMYVVFTTDHSFKKKMGRSVVARSRDDGQTFEVLYDLSRDKFINVSFWPAGRWLYIYGSGDYRKSSVYLARVKPEYVEGRSKLQYFSGIDPGQRVRWSSKEADAAPLFQHNVVGEFSVAYLEPVQRYVMLHNSREPRGITMRSAETPWGPWSQGTMVYQPWRDKGYGQFVHASARSARVKDALSDPRRENEWGGEYGPYIMARYTSGSGEGCRIYYTMSTWNPYQVVVMQSDLSFSPDVPGQ